LIIFLKTVNIELTNINNIMKYNNWYNDIVERARDRNLDTYTETHHILPRSLGGDDSTDNLVELTAREHFVCHWLLVKMTTGEARGKMINALYMMQTEGPYQKRYKTKITGRIYEHLRKEYAQYISKKNKGRIQPPEEKEKQIKSQTGRKRETFSVEWREKLSQNHKSKQLGFDGTLSKDTRKKMSEKATGRKQSPETIAKKSAAIKGSKREKFLCPHCQKLISVNTYPRWHGDNCKYKKE
jgi:hypothetical protein